MYGYRVVVGVGQGCSGDLAVLLLAGCLRSGECRVPFPYDIGTLCVWPRRAYIALWRCHVRL